MGLEVELWHDTIQEKLLQDNSFLNYVSNVEKENILNGKIVHIPQAGAPSNVVKNRTVVPADVRKRADGEVLYSIDEYTTDPVYIPNAETKELSYDKRRSVLDQDVANLSEEVAEGMLLNFIASPVGDNATMPATSILLTSGSATASGLVGSTGNRKAYQLSDLQMVRAFMVKQRAWSENNMIALLSADAIVQMFPANSQVTATYMQNVTEAERRSGVVAKAYGWKIMERSTVYHLGQDKTFKPFGTVAEATDSEGSFFWNSNMLEKAIGSTETFERERDPQYYGDIYSFLARMGGRHKRKNYEGAAVLMQAPAI